MNCSKLIYHPKEMLGKVLSPRDSISLIALYFAGSLSCFCEHLSDVVHLCWPEHTLFWVESVLYLVLPTHCSGWCCALQLPLQQSCHPWLWQVGNCYQVDSCYLIYFVHGIAHQCLYIFLGCMQIQSVFLSAAAMLWAHLQAQSLTSSGLIQ